MVDHEIYMLDCQFEGIQVRFDEVHYYIAMAHQQLLFGIDIFIEYWACDAGDVPFCVHKLEIVGFDAV